MMNIDDDIHPLRDAGARVALETALAWREKLGEAGAAEAAHGAIEMMAASIANWTSAEEAFARVYTAARCVQLAGAPGAPLSPEESRDAARRLITETLVDLPDPLQAHMIPSLEGAMLAAFASLACISSPSYAAEYAGRLTGAGKKLGAVTPAGDGRRH